MHAYSQLQLTSPTMAGALPVPPVVSAPPALPSASQDLLRNSKSLHCFNLSLCLRLPHQLFPCMFHHSTVRIISLWLRNSYLSIHMLTIIVQVEQLTSTWTGDIVTAMDRVTLWTWQSASRIKIQNTVEPITRTSWISSCNMTQCYGFSTYLISKSPSMYTTCFVEKHYATTMLKSCYSEITMLML